MLTLPSFAGPTSARSVTRTVRMRFSVGTAVYTSEPMLGVRSWITANMKKDRVGAEEALCLWLNSTPGLLLRLCNANRPYLGRSALPHELMRTLPVLNIETLSNKQLRRACAIFSKLKDKSLKGFGELASDPVRRELDRRLFAEVLGHNETEPPRVSERLHFLGGWSPWEDRGSTHRRFESGRSGWCSTTNISTTRSGRRSGQWRRRSGARRRRSATGSGRPSVISAVVRG